MDALSEEIAIDVACGVSGGKNDGSAIGLLAVGKHIDGLAPHALVAVDYETCHAGEEMYLATRGEYGLTYVFDHSWQMVGTNVWVGVGENVWRGTMLTEYA